MNARRADALATVMFWTGTGLVLAVLVSLLGYIFWHGIKAISWHFLMAPPQTIAAGGGIGPELFNSFYLLRAAFPSLVTGTIMAAGRSLVKQQPFYIPPVNFSDWNPLSPASPINPFRPAETFSG